MLGCMVTAVQLKAQERRRQEAVLMDEALSSLAEFCRWVQVESEPTEDNPRGIAPFEPYPWQRERIPHLDAWESEVWLKARQNGASTLAQIRALYVALHMGNQTVLIYSMDQDAAWEFLYDLRRMWEYLPPWLRIPLVVDNKGELEFENGSRVVTFASTANAGSGRTADLVIADEAAKAPYARESYRAYGPALGRGQLIMMATMKEVTGHFFKEVWEGCKTKQYPYTPVFVGAMEVPERQREVIDENGNVRNPWWEDICRKYPDEDERGAEFPLIEADAFRAARSGLVYPMFDVNRHVVSEWPTTNSKGAPFRWEDAKYRYAGCDFGISMPSAMVAVGVSGSGRLHVFGEFYKVGADLVEMGEWLAEWDKRGRLNQVLCDPSETAAINTLMLKFPTFPANNNRSFGINMVKYLLNNDRLTVANVCQNLIKEFGDYREGRRHDPNTRELYPTLTPVDHHGDALDAGRYAICGAMQNEGLGDLYSGKARFGKVVW